MYTRILVPLDGSKLAEQVLPYVRFLAKGLKTRIELLRVFYPAPLEAAYLAQRMYPPQIIAGMSQHARDYLETIAESLRKDGLTVLSTVPEGRVDSYIVSEAEKDPTTLIAMSTHGHGFIKDVILGSVADTLRHHTDIPILMIRASVK